MLIFTAFRYETDSFSAPIINVYSPGFKSADGVKVNDTCFELPASIGKESSLNDPVEFPRSPFGVKVSDAIILIFELDDVATRLTLTSALSPLFVVNSLAEMETE
jgi:hypothetical protein